MKSTTKFAVILLACASPFGAASAQACLSSASLSTRHVQIALAGTRLSGGGESLEQWGLQGTVGATSMGFISAGYIDMPSQHDNVVPATGANVAVGKEFQIATSKFEFCPIVSGLWQKASASGAGASQTQSALSFGGAIGARIPWSGTTMFVPSLRADYNLVTFHYTCGGLGCDNTFFERRGTLTLGAGIDFNDRVTITPSVGRWVGLAGTPVVTEGITFSFSLGGR